MKKEQFNNCPARSLHKKGSTEREQGSIFLYETWIICQKLKIITGIKMSLITLFFLDINKQNKHSTDILRIWIIAQAFVSGISSLLNCKFPTFLLWLSVLHSDLNKFFSEVIIPLLKNFHLIKLNVYQKH